MAYYDDSTFDYRAYWQGREYEHQSEVLALTKLLGNKHFETAVDVGGGYGRMTREVANYATQTNLVEPSFKLRRQAKSYLKTMSKKINISAGTLEKTGQPDESCDLITHFRVMHHVTNVESAFQEMYRVLKPGGLVVFEFANSCSFKTQILAFLTGKRILLTPLERRSAANIRNKTIPFVNHHPETILKLLKKQGFVIEELLSVSNFRLGLVKRFIPEHFLLWLEKHLQKPLAKFYFGPSIFLKAHKA